MADEVVELSRTELERGVQMGFEVVRGEVTERGVAAFGVVVSEVVADIEPGIFQPRKAAAVEQFGFEAAPKRCGVGRTR
ncbi:MAG: hypothetical protein NVSMB30_23980 [Hymenobacter sp.]